MGAVAYAADADKVRIMFRNHVLDVRQYLLLQDDADKVYIMLRNSDSPSCPRLVP